ncbi:MAG: PIN domain nuclease [Anaerolineales bacterium]|nr:PIN domain nuclease [Anaerolineales bacterium]MCW5855729.1 PIN domain nuclease [Anaerolineales bacterium]
MSIAFFSRLVGMLVFGIAGWYLGGALAPLVGSQDITLWSQAGSALGALVGLLLTPWLALRPLRATYTFLSQLSLRSLMAGLLGLILGLIVSGLLAVPLSLLPQPLSQILPIVVAVALSYLGVVTSVNRQGEIFSIFSNFGNRAAAEGRSKATPAAGRTILTDTSVIIDGRITDIARTGFLSGTLLIPRFVLNELQHIADSSDKLRRQRGRRGLEVLAALQKDPHITVQISDIDVEGMREVDDKLVVLARQMHAPILTNDFNLNRVADLQGVLILNINDLANAVKSVFLPGEELTVRVIQEGREHRQGVGYLEDGTMVVVQDGVDFMGAEVRTSVTKVLQTAAGRMVFAKPEEKPKNSPRPTRNGGRKR